MFGAKSSTLSSFAALSSNNTGTSGFTGGSGPFSGAGAALFGEKEGEGYNEDNYDPHYEAIVQVTKLDTIKTGEEDDEIVFKHRAKLYRFDKQWKDRGIGDIKLTKNVKTGYCRVIMRRDIVYKLCANHAIMPNMELNMLESSDRSWIWFTPSDYSEGLPPQPQQFCVKFKNKQVATEFKTRFEELKLVKDDLLPAEKSNEEKSVETKPLLDNQPAELAWDKKEIASTTEDIAFKFGLKERQWQCSVCLVKNEKIRNTCVSCNTSKTNLSTLSKNKNEMKFGADSTESSSTKFSFGLPQAESISFGTSNRDAFKFPSSNGSQPLFGGIKESNTNIPSPNLLNAASEDRIRNSPFYLTKNHFANYSPFKFVVPGAKPDFSSIQEASKDEQNNLSISPEKDSVELPPSSPTKYNNNEDPHIHVEPTVYISKLDKVKTGEEGEDILFCNRAKLYTFSSDSKTWKERGIGEIKLTHNKEQETCRVIMRRDQVHKLCANHAILEFMELKPLKSEKSWTWFTQADISDGEIKPEQFSVRFKTVEIAQEFKSIFGKCLRLVKKKTVASAETNEKLKESFLALESVIAVTDVAWQAANPAVTIDSNSEPSNPISFKFGTNQTGKSLFETNPPQSPPSSGFSFGMPKTSEASGFSFGQKSDVSLSGFSFGVAKNQETPSLSIDTQQAQKGNSFEAKADFLSTQEKNNDTENDRPDIEKREPCNQQKSTPRSLDPDPNPWQCSACLLQNHNSREICRSCSSSRMQTPVVRLDPKKSSDPVSLTFKNRDQTPMVCAPKERQSKSSATLFGTVSSLGTKNTTKDFSLGRSNLPELNLTAVSDCELMLSSKEIPIKTNTSLKNKEKSFETGPLLDNQAAQLARDEREIASITEDLAFKFGLKERQWQCSVCLVKNEKIRNTCVSCNTSKTNLSTLSKNKNGMKFGADSTESSSTKFSFGLPQAVGISFGTSNRGAFKFPLSNGFQPLFGGTKEFNTHSPSPNLLNAASEDGIRNFPFDLTKNQFLNDTPFKFVVPDAKLDSISIQEANKNAQKSVSISPGKDWVELPPSSPTKYNNNDDPDIHVEAIVHISKLDKVKTGEKGEDILFCNRAKLYTFSSDSKTWKERGIGEIKLTHNQEHDTCRVIMNRDQVHKLCANHPIVEFMELKPSKSEKSWTWFTQADISDGEIKPEQFSVRFKTVEIAQEFKSIFGKCLRLVKKKTVASAETNEKLKESFLALESVIAVTDVAWQAANPAVIIDSNSEPSNPISFKFGTNQTGKSLFEKNPPQPPPSSGISFGMSKTSEASGFSFGQKADVSLSGFSFGVAKNQETLSLLFGTQQAQKSISFEAKADFLSTQEKNDDTENDRPDIEKREPCNQQKSTPRSLDPDPNPWQCSACLLQNHSSREICRSCSSPRMQAPVVWLDPKNFLDPVSLSFENRDQTPMVCAPKERQSKSSATLFGTVSSLGTKNTTKDFSLGRSNLPKLNLTAVSDCELMLSSKEIPIKTNTSLKNKEKSFETEPLLDNQAAQLARDEREIASITEDLAFKFGLKERQWQCSVCLVKNEKIRNTCVSCNTSKTNLSTLSKNKNGMKFGADSTESSSTKFSFGLPQAERISFGTSNRDAFKFPLSNAFQPLFGGTKESNIHSPSRNLFNAASEDEIRNSPFNLTKNQFVNDSPFKFVVPSAKADSSSIHETNKEEEQKSVSISPEKDSVELPPSSPTKYNNNDDPDVHVEAIVHISKLDKVTTGEEGEDILFCNRAKLYRFSSDSKTWKERGIGEIKLTHNKEQETCRVIMRRDQVHKLCANHAILEFMELKPSKSEKSWTWFTQADISDGEIKPEQFSVRFKTVEIAQEFKSIFGKCLRLVKKKTVASAETNEKLKESFLALESVIAVTDVAWQAANPAVTIDSNSEPSNPISFKFGTNQTGKSLLETNPPQSPPSSGFSFGMPKTSEASGFSFGQKSDVSLSGFSFGVAKNQETLSVSFGTQQAQKGISFEAKADFLSTQEKNNDTENDRPDIEKREPCNQQKSTPRSLDPDPNPWQCSACLLQNHNSREICRSCSSPRMQTLVVRLDPKKSSDPVSLTFENRDQTPMVYAPKEGRSKFSEPLFGTGLSLGAKNTAKDFAPRESSLPKPNLTAVLDRELMPAPKDIPIKTNTSPKQDGTKKEKGSIFNWMPKGLSVDHLFSFGTTPSPTLSAASCVDDIAATSFANVPSAFSGTTFCFKFENPAKSPVTKEAKSPETTSPTALEEESTAAFTPLVTLTKVEKETGEEQENVMFCERTKMFRFDSEWKERGVGEIKILKHKDSGLFRLIMRRDRTHKLCANHGLITGMQIKRMSGNNKRAYVWKTNADASGDEGLREEMFAARFKEEEIAERFSETFTLACEEAKFASGYASDSKEASAKAAPDILQMVSESNRASQVIEKSDDDEEVEKPSLPEVVSLTYDPTLSEEVKEKAKQLLLTKSFYHTPSGNIGKYRLSKTKAGK